MTHVFIVDKNTFKYHLKYLFAGTGAKDKPSPFLTDSTVSFPPATERLLVGMIADISRIRINDKVVFYLQASNGMSGMFFGIFRVCSLPFFDENDADNYLYHDTDKYLSFRVLLEPDEVYPKGISEHEYLDSLKGKVHPSDLCWSLIYRKLKGNRGCTMIMDYEFDDLVEKLKQKNNNTTLLSASYSFDETTYEIIRSANDPVYSGRRDSLNILPRLVQKYNSRHAFETHLQAYIMQNCDKEPLKSLLLPIDVPDLFIGNEVSCGVGMQRIDVMLKQETPDEVYFRIIELKDEAPKIEIVHNQLPWYLEWFSDYIIPKYNKRVIVIPSIIAKGMIPNNILEAFQSFTYTIEGVDVRPLEYFGFEIENSEIVFTKYL